MGAEAVMDGKAERISGVRVLGRYRLQIRLTKPLGDFTARLTLPFFCPSCRTLRSNLAGSTIRPAPARTTSRSTS